MTTQKRSSIKQLEHDLPEGLLVDARWLTERGYSTSLRSKYVAAGWLEQPSRGVYRRSRGTLKWQHVAISLQTLLRHSLAVGGRTALELQGYAHYLSQQQLEVHLYGPEAPPSWLSKLPLETRFLYHNDQKLFRSPSINHSLSSLDKSEADTEAARAHWLTQPWGQWDWALTLSTPERAILELLDELPDRESFHQVDMLMQGLANLSPRRLQTLLEICHSVKVKRLFFYFADRHQHSWLKHLDKNAVDFGEGKRMLVRGGKLDKAYQITVPGDLDAVR